jgi:hypothetical protein
MNRVGVLCDLSHVGEKTATDAIEYSKQPCSITHCLPSALKDVARNKSDELFRLCASTAASAFTRGNELVSPVAASFVLAGSIVGTRKRALILGSNGPLIPRSALSSHRSQAAVSCAANAPVSAGTLPKRKSATDRCASSDSALRPVLPTSVPDKHPSLTGTAASVLSKRNGTLASCRFTLAAAGDCLNQPPSRHSSGSARSKPSSSMLCAARRSRAGCNSRMTSPP